MEIRELIPVIIAIVIGVIALGISLYTNVTFGGQLSAVDENLSFDIEEAQGLTSSLQKSINSLQSSMTISAQNSSVTSQQIENIQTRLSNISSQLNTSKDSNSQNLEEISSQLANISATILVLSEKVNAFNPKLPNSTLVIIENSFDSSSNTFRFLVENTQDTLIYVQLVGNMYSLNCSSNGLAGTYYSEIYEFKPGATTETTLNLHLGSYFTCVDPYINQLTVNFIIAPDISISPVYTFNIVPKMLIP